MKKIITIAVIVALILIGVICIVQSNRNQKNYVANTTSTTKEKTPTLVRVNEVTRSVFYSPQYVAIALGFFEENGIEVELTNGGGADNVMTAVLSGQSDIGFCRTRSINLCVQRRKNRLSPSFRTTYKKRWVFFSKQSCYQ